MKVKSWVDLLLYALIAAALIVAGFGAYQYFLAPSSMIITWSTENEIDILGFNIYRADHADGSCPADIDRYSKLNGDLIPAINALLGNEHEFIDEQVERNRTYCYHLETVNLDGNIDLTENPIILP